MTLHNSAIVDWEQTPNDSISKLLHLIQHPPFPDQSVPALLLLYCHPEIGLERQASDFINSHPDWIQYLHPDSRSQIEASILKTEDPEECIQKLQALSDRQLRSLKCILSSDLNEATLEQRLKFKSDSEAYLSGTPPRCPHFHGSVSVVMLLGHVYYERGDYSAVEQLLLHSMEICGMHVVWKTNVGHTFFVQGKYEEAVGYYEDIVRDYDRLLDVTPVIVANLCASYIMINQVQALLSTYE